MMLQDKVVIVTGSGGGLGEGIARICCREGAKVVVADIREDAARQAAAGIGESAWPVRCDVRDDAQLASLVDASIAHFGRIDGLVNNAGVNFAKPFLDTTAEDWDRVISVDLRAVFFLSQLVCRRMLRQQPKGGSVVNISSVHSLAALPGAGAYDAAKCGVVGMSRSLAVEMAPEDIRVNCVSPGLLNTKIWQDIMDAAPSHDECMKHWWANIPIGRVIETQEIAELVAFLLSDRSSCITGANILADGGMTSQLVSREPYQARAIEGR